MIKRKGFVSNSSSTSFILDGEYYSLDKIKEYLKLLVDAENCLEDTDLKLDEVCKIYEENSAYNILKKIIEYENYDMNYTDSQIETLINNTYEYKKFRGKVIIIDSIEDNSIPWHIQCFLQENGYRQHWG